MQRELFLNNPAFVNKNLRKANKRYFHLNIEFQTQGLFKSLDWIYIQKQSEKSKLHFRIELQALVMMDTHIHYLIATEDSSENYFFDHLCKNLKIEQDPNSFSEPITNYSQYLNTYKYIYRNPVVAHLSKDVETYPYSSIQIILGKIVPYCFIEDQLGLIQNPIHTLHWLNSEKQYKISQLKLLRQANSFSI